MRVMTWNVWWRFGGNWRKREPGIAAVLAERHPDIVGLVETWSGGGTSQPDVLAEPLGMHALFVPTSLPPLPDPVETPEQTGIDIGLGLLSRWPVTATQIHELPVGRRGGRPPTALAATLAHPAGPLHVIVACTEWEPQYADTHLAQCEVLADLATDPKLDGPQPVLLIGDLNAAPDQPELRPLLDTMVDTWQAGGGDPAAVTLDPVVPFAPLEASKQIGRRIDHVLVRPGRPGEPVRVKRAFLAGNRPLGGLYPSDHYAVGADLDV
jgi:endonuclease/exonuclease/phosphatase family metal-dependent hydrolase